MNSLPPKTRNEPRLAAGEATELYLELLKKTLSRSLFDRCLDPLSPPRGSLKRAVVAPLQRILSTRRLVLARCIELGPEVLAQSPPPSIKHAETLIGPQGLDNLRECILDVLREGVPGDLLEAGVWRGGAAIFMRAVLKCYGETDRLVWAADSFRGLPEPDLRRHPPDAGEMDWSKQDWLAASLDEVKGNFARYGLLDEQVRFLVGWFHETLPTAPIERLALVRLDADMYGSTMDALRTLYPKLSVGGYIIIDDYWLPGCRAAVDEYRAEQGITEQIVPVDRAIVYWRRLH